MFSVSIVSAQKKKAFNNLTDSISYAFGVSMYEGTKNFSHELDYDMVMKAIKDSEKDKALMSGEEANEYITLIHNQSKDEAMKKAKEESVAFLEKNKDEEGVEVTESGLQYKVVNKGDGANPTKNSRVKVHYEGTLIDGTIFDSSYSRGEPAEFNLSAVIPGWTEGLQLMPAGSEYIFYIPADLAYGDREVGGVIPPGSALIFKVELLEIVK